MKKLATLLAAALLATLAGCGTVLDDIDSTKTQINVYVVNGGYGLDWAQAAAEEFNALEENAAYQVKIYPHNDGLTNIETNLKTGVSNAHIYFTTTPDIKSMISAGLLADITSVLDAKVDGNDVTVGQKLKSADLYRAAFSGLDGNGVYAVPYGDSFAGLVYDQQLFLDNGWLCVETTGGSARLTAGPDGVIGTYDDGQPVTMAEWEGMLERIVSSGAFPFLYTTKYANYMNPIADAALVQYEGLENYQTYCTYRGDHTATDGTVTHVTPETGYQVFGMEGIGKALSFVDTYLVDNENYVHPASYKTLGLTHKEAQNKFILGYKGAEGNPQAAFLVEGTWWENEARTIFKNLEANSEPDRGYGKREYRYMLLPEFSGQRGTDGAGGGRVVAAKDCGVGFVVERENAAEVETAKRFLAFTCSDKYLKEFTKRSGAVRPFVYDLTDAEKAALTPFQKNVWEIYNDTEHVTMVRPAVEKLLSPLNYATSKSTSNWYTTVDDAVYTDVLTGLTKVSAEAYDLGIRKYYTASRWAGYYAVAEKYL